MLNKTTACRSLSEAAATLATSLAGALDCDRVSIALRHRQQTKLVGSSDGWEAEPSAFDADVCSAMDEAMDAAETIVYPTPTGRRNWPVAAHAHLTETRETRALCTIPLASHGEIVGALLAERRLGRPFLAEERDWLERLAQAVAPWLAQCQRLD